VDAADTNEFAATALRWSGREARLLRHALRLSVRAFAGYLGVAPRTVAKWESGGTGTIPRPDTQAILDTALAHARPDARQRFEVLLRQAGAIPPPPVPLPAAPGYDYDAWADDLDRILASLGRQEFPQARMLLDRWLNRFEPNSNDTRGMYLYGRSLRLFGELQQDQGVILGPLSAQQTYRKALRVFAELDTPRRVAQLELQLVVLDEMAGRLESAARRYESLTTDERLTEHDRTRARLWVGTALSKRGLNESATRHIVPAIQHFEAMEEPADWSIAHQKLALAHRGAGKLADASRAIEVALTHRVGDTPMQKVRLETAYAHILLSDRGTAENGMALLEKCARTSTEYGLMHQLHSIDGIRRSYERQS
jgi:transcriptional regulator with XRE-family HTH domain